jgi:hypothetical protein
MLRSNKPAELKLFALCKNKNTLAAMFTNVKCHCKLHSEEHVPVLEEAKKRCYA